jgi:hypothetical protein
MNSWPKPDFIGQVPDQQLAVGRKRGCSTVLLVFELLPHASSWQGACRGESDGFSPMTGAPSMETFASIATKLNTLFASVESSYISISQSAMAPVD